MRACLCLRLGVFTLHHSSFRQGLSLSLELNTWLGELASDFRGSTCLSPNAEITGTCFHVWLSKSYWKYELQPSTSPGSPFACWVVSSVPHPLLILFIPFSHQNSIVVNSSLVSHTNKDNQDFPQNVFNSKSIFFLPSLLLFVFTVTKNNLVHPWEIRLRQSGLHQCIVTLHCLFSC